MFAESDFITTTIQTADGSRATIRDGTWHSDDPGLLANVIERSRHLPPAYRPDPDRNTAEEVARLICAKVVTEYQEPEATELDPPGLVY